MGIVLGSSDAAKCRPPVVQRRPQQRFKTEVAQNLVLMHGHRTGELGRCEMYAGDANPASPAILPVSLQPKGPAAGAKP